MTKEFTIQVEVLFDNGVTKTFTANENGPHDEVMGYVNVLTEIAQKYFKHKNDAVGGYINIGIHVIDLSKVSSISILMT